MMSNIVETIRNCFYSKFNHIMSKLHELNANSGLEHTAVSIFTTTHHTTHNIQQLTTLQNTTPHSQHLPQDFFFSEEAVGADGAHKVAELDLLVLVQRIQRVENLLR